MKTLSMQCRHEIRKAKVHLELKAVRGMKGNQKVFPQVTGKRKYGKCGSATEWGRGLMLKETE